MDRIIKDIPLKNGLLSTIKKTYKDLYKAAKKVGKLIEEEIGYVTGYIRLGIIYQHVTMGIKNIMDTRKILLHASGESKAEILSRAYMMK